MKKVVLLLVIILAISFTSAVHYTCSDGDNVKFKSEEIDEGETDSVLGLSIGLCMATENSYSQWVEGVVFIDASSLTMVANVTYGTELVSGNTSIIYYGVADSDSATIKIGSSSQEIELGECTQVGGVEVMLASISGSGSGSTVKVLIGDIKKTLHTIDNPSEIVEFDSDEYGMEIVSGSSSGSTIRVSECSGGDLVEIAQNTTVATNSTTNNTSTNQTSTNSTATNSTTTNSTASNNTNQNSTANQENETEKKGFFRRIWNWFRGLFS